ncbi:MAG TPA: S41 family peptidase [Bryobacterales bacterium]|nr:S41 family peptidase [Bryobacterales bacterium]
MTVRGKGRALWLAALTIVLCSLAGGIYGPRMRAAAAPPEDDLRQSIRTFANVYHLVEDNYADKLNADTAIYSGAIPGMLHELDPHSTFFDPEQFSALREEQKGHYAGVGMTVGPRNRFGGRENGTVVIAPFPKTPAYRAGIRPGDVISKVDGESVENLSVNDVAKRLRGEKGTTVTITVLREGHDQPLEFTVVRDEIPRKSVPVAFFLKPGIAYVKIESFNETTGRELLDAMKTLNENTFKGLILDLRENRGGLLSEGVAVGDHFLKKGQIIVSHHGRASAEHAYRATHGNQGRNYPMVVMVNCDSASAAEIVAGALQDHDRALIVGSSTFGKGLVQTVYPLNHNAGLALTTAKYYTPSGRLIQRAYNNISLYEYYSDPCRENHRAAPKLDVKMTDGGRPVYGGDGITPDVKLPTQRADKFQNVLLRRSAFFAYAQHFFTTHDKLPPNWQPDQATLDDFRQFLYKEKIPFTEADFARNVDFIKRFLEREIYISGYDLDEGAKVYVENDPDVQAAAEQLPKARALADQAQRMIAQRESR